MRCACFRAAAAVRTGFKVELMSFVEQSGKSSDGKAGFVHYADDGVRVAEQKLARAEVVMADDEKKEKFCGGV